jgi:ElaB/YqjD/DUF883 family membrane-anchored ribosome-binding protein
MTHAKTNSSPANAHPELSDALDNLKRNFARLEEDAVKLLQGAMDVGRHGAGAATDAAGSTVEQIGQQARNLRDRGAKAVESVQGSIEEHPLMSVAIAFAAGYAVAAMFRRK